MIPISACLSFRLRAIRPAFLAALALAGLTASAHADIIADGGFESGAGGNIYSAGQSLDGGSWNVTQGYVYLESGDPYVYSGNNSLNLTYVNPYAENSVTQTVATIAGDEYTVSFWANADTANTFSLTENGFAIPGDPTSIAENGFPGDLTNSSLFTDYSGTFTATSSSTTLDFTALANPPIGAEDSSVMIDNVSLTATPEPASFGLLFTGLAVLGLAAGKKRIFPSAIEN